MKKKFNTKDLYIIGVTKIIKIEIKNGMVNRYFKVPEYYVAQKTKNGGLFDMFYLITNKMEIVALDISEVGDVCYLRDKVQTFTRKIDADGTITYKEILDFEKKLKDRFQEKLKDKKKRENTLR